MQQQPGKQSMAASPEQSSIAAEVCWKQEPTPQYISPSLSPLTGFFPLNASSIVPNLLLHLSIERPAEAR
jgi:hypothetical protein